MRIQICQRKHRYVLIRWLCVYTAMGNGVWIGGGVVGLLSLAVAA